MLFSDVGRAADNCSCMIGTSYVPVGRVAPAIFFVPNEHIQEGLRVGRGRLAKWEKTCRRSPQLSA
jgi:hypothetical protein